MKGLLAAIVGLASVSIVNALPVELDKRAIDSGLLSQLAFFEQYSAAAYCPANNSPGSSTTITCSAGNCPRVQGTGAVSVLEFQNKGLVDATGFVAVDKVNKLIVIAFRGSHSVVNFLADAQIAQLKFACDTCWVHAGFLSSWLATRDGIKSAVAAARTANPGFSVVATGHSLGAAIATVAVSELRSLYPVALYTYGSPMVGDPGFANFVTNQPGGNYRVTHQSDVVPKLPGYGILNYRHVSPQYWITSGDGATVTTNDVQVSSGIKDTGGNYGTSGISVSNHLWYFNSVSACAPDTLELS